MKKIADYKIISTTKGDQGTSRNYSNEEYSKSDILFDVLGNLDELSSTLGIVYHFTKDNKDIKGIQKNLQDISSLVATSNKVIRETKLVQITDEDISKLELLEQTLLKKSKIEPVFVLPGSDTSKNGAFYDLARSIARRGERSLVKFIEKNKRDDLNMCLKYLNRLSDLLFIYARSLA